MENWEWKIAMGAGEWTHDSIRAQNEARNERWNLKFNEAKCIGAKWKATTANKILRLALVSIG